MSSAWEKMRNGQPYDPNDADLVARRARAQHLQRAYNQTVTGDPARPALLAAMTAQLGTNSEIRAPFYIEYGGNIRIGTQVFLNYNCLALDVCPITIGDKTQIGPGVQFLTADHPRDPVERASGVEFGQPIQIGHNVWIGGGALILPGVTVGEDAIIGAGAVVTRDVAPGTTVAGNPARVIAGSPP